MKGEMPYKHHYRCHKVAQMVKNKPAMQETQVWSLGGEDTLEKGMATHSSILAWRIPRMEELGGLQSMGSHRVRHDWAALTFMRKWGPQVENLIQQWRRGADRSGAPVACAKVIKVVPTPVSWTLKLLVCRCPGVQAVLLWITCWEDVSKKAAVWSGRGSQTSTLGRNRGVVAGGSLDLWEHQGLN